MGDADLERVCAAFARAVRLALSGPGSHAPVLDVAEVGSGGEGFVLRGCVHLQERGLRVEWLVLKGPRPSALRSAGGRTFYGVDDDSIVTEGENREKIGHLPGFGAIPTLIALNSDAIRPHLPPDLALMQMPKEVKLLRFPRPAEPRGQPPPEALVRLVRRAARTARDLANWCELVRCLGTAIASLHAIGWCHGDIKLENIVAQEDSGLLRSIEVIDFGSATKSNDPNGLRGFTERDRDPDDPRPSPMSHDLFTFGKVLAHYLLGQAGGESATDIKRRLEERRRELEERQGQGGEPIDEDLNEAFGLVRDFFDHSRADGFAAISDLLRRADHLRTRALYALEQGRGSSQEEDLLPRQLDRLRFSLSETDLKWWCGRYIQAEIPVAARGFDESLDLLRHGYVRRAAADFDRMLPSGDAELDAHVLRIYVGQILLREDETRKAGEVLDRFAGREGADPKLGWWLRMLRARVRYQEGRDVRAELAELTERVEALPGDRPRAWLDALRMLVALSARRRGEVAPRLELAELEAKRQFVRRNASTPEMMFAIVQIARYHAEAPPGPGHTESGLVTALRWVHAGVGETSARAFPLEYATLLMVAADIVQRAYRNGLARVDAVGALDAAEQLALHAAAVFARLEVGAQRDRALRVAARCALERGDDRSIARAITWGELSRANAALDGRADHRSPLVEACWQKRKRDPCPSGARIFYERYGEEIQALWETGGLGIELVEGGKPVPNAVLGDLLLDVRPAPRHVLVLGCGPGAGAFHLADEFPEAQILGIDVSRWNVATAEATRDSRGISAARCRFRVADLFDGDRLLEDHLSGPGPWDLVVLRDVLCHVTFKGRFLRKLRRHLLEGTEVRISEPVQGRATAAREWHDALASIGVNNLTTAVGLCSYLEEAGFAVTSGPRDLSAHLEPFFAGRLERLLGLEAAGRVDSTVARRMERTLRMLRNASRDGVLGWVAAGARVAAWPPASIPPESDVRRSTWPVT